MLTIDCCAPRYCGVVTPIYTINTKLFTIFILIYWTAKNNYFKDCLEIFRIGNYCGHGMSGIIRN